MNTTMINKILCFFGLRLVRIQEVPKEFTTNYNRNLARFKNNKGLNVFRDFRYDAGIHPKDSGEYQCEFAAHHLSQLSPSSKILDIGSYRRFILGLLAHYRVTTIDVRERKSCLSSENVITCDAKNLSLPDDEFDAVLSLCTLEHLGLGRYGDEIDLDADKKALKEMLRALKPGGYLIFTTEITRAKPFIGFNAHKVYGYEMLREFCSGLKCLEEKFWSRKTKDFCSLKEVTAEPRNWDIYCGCYEKL